MLPHGMTVKSCGCGRKYDGAAWAALPFVVDQVTEDETGRYSTEMRNCACNSTIAVERKLPPVARYSLLRARALVDALRDAIEATDENAAQMAIFLSLADATARELERADGELFVGFDA